MEAVNTTTSYHFETARRNMAVCGRTATKNVCPRCSPDAGTLTRQS